jgi:hypothetical protein
MPFESLLEESEYISTNTNIKHFCVICYFLIVYSTCRNSASLLIKQKLIFAGTEKGKLLALRQSFQEVYKSVSCCVSITLILCTWYIFMIPTDEQLQPRNLEL